MAGKVDLELTQFYDFVAFHLAYLRPLANGLSTDPPLFVVSTQFVLASLFNQTKYCKGRKTRNPLPKSRRQRILIIRDSLCPTINKVCIFSRGLSFSLSPASPVPVRGQKLSAKVEQNLLRRARSYLRSQKRDFTESELASVEREELGDFKNVRGRKSKALAKTTKDKARGM